MSSQKTVAFFGATTGVGLSALKSTLAAGHQCIALCRTPSKLTAIIDPSSMPTLQIVEGNAHDVAAVSKCLKTKDGRLVDAIVTTIGNRPSLTHMGLEDPHVCEKGMKTLLESLAELRRSGVTGQPLIVACSTTGLSRFGRDVPIAMVPLYHVGLKVPHKDKTIMEDTLVASGEEFTIIRPSLLTNGESDKEIRAGIEDPKSGRESKAIGYTISREDAGRWVAENLVLEKKAKYLNKIAMITY